MAETGTTPPNPVEADGVAPAATSAGKATPKQGLTATRRRGARKATTSKSSQSASRGTTGRITADKSADTDATPIAAVETAAPIVAIAKPVKAVARSAKRRATAAARPVTASVGRVTAKITRRARSTASVARTGSTRTRQRIDAGAAAVSRTASDAYEATRSAAVSRTAVVLGAAAAGLVTGLVVNLGRKAVVQAPSVLAGDWFEAIKVEHKMALGLFDAIEATTDDEPAKREMLLIQLTHALSKHAFTEENLIYPALREWGDKADADKLTHDHGYVKQHLYDLDGVEPASAGFLAKIAAFRADLEAHIAEEEQSIFPPLHAGLDEQQNGKITALANKEGFKLA